MRQDYWIMLVALVFVVAYLGVLFRTNRQVHPGVLFKLFMVELWERFSFYGMRAFLVLYLGASLVNGGFGMGKEKYAVYAAFGALVYLTPLAGGLIAGKLIGFRAAIIWGAILMAAGQFTMGFGVGNEYALYTGLALLVTGNGFFKPNISSMIGRFYPSKVDADRPLQEGEKEDPDGKLSRKGYYIFYIGINVGAFISPLTCGAVAEIHGWQYGFLLAGTGMAIGLLLFLTLSSKGFLLNHADAPEDAPAKTLAVPTRPAVIIGTFLFVPLAALMMAKNSLTDYILGGIGLVAIVYMFLLSLRYPKEQRQRMWVIMFLSLAASVFWCFFELAGSAMNVFTKENVNRVVFGVEIPASSFQALNALFIMFFAPVYSVMWDRMKKSDREPAAPVKFAIGLIVLGLGFLVLNLGRGAAVLGVMPVIFLVLMYLLHTLGELALSPVGLDTMQKLTPEKKYLGFVMGFWFLASALGFLAGGFIGGESSNVAEGATTEQKMNQALDVFNNVGLVAIAAGVVFLVLSPLLRKWMHGVR
jgi:POT family proton-dependent oligopeptide transporter